jgi:NAD(P)-dependent dehydrogenase (short-subunit alcohol dehydrogenase family)
LKARPFWSRALRAVSGKRSLATFVAEGARVAVTDLDTAMLTTTADARFDGDLTDRAFCDALPRQVHDRFGRLDILVNNAGMIVPWPC